MQQSIVKFIA